MKAGISPATEAGKNTAQKILAIIGQKPEITHQELGMELGITNSGVKYHLKKLQRAESAPVLGSVLGSSNTTSLMSCLGRAPGLFFLPFFLLAETVLDVKGLFFPVFSLS
jgi:hypothetical protein